MGPETLLKISSEFWWWEKFHFWMNYPFKKPEGFFYYYYFLGKITFQSKSVNKTFSKKCDGVCVCIYIYIYIFKVDWKMWGQQKRDSKDIS